MTPINPILRKIAIARLLTIRGMTFLRLSLNISTIAILLKQYDIPQWPWLPIVMVGLIVVSLLWGAAEDHLGLIRAEQDFFATRTTLLTDIHAHTKEPNAQT